MRISNFLESKCQSALLDLLQTLSHIRMMHWMMHPAPAMGPHSIGGFFCFFTSPQCCGPALVLLLLKRRGAQLPPWSSLRPRWITMAFGQSQFPGPPGSGASQGVSGPGEKTPCGFGGWVS